MSTSIDAGGLTSAPDAPTGTARAHEAEADTAQPVAANLRGVSPDLHRDDAASMEHERQAMLRRWQAER